MKIGSTKDISVQRACVLITGLSGVGKTSLVKSLPEKETLIISMESGLLSLSGTNYPVVEVKTKAQLDEVCAYLHKEHPFKFVFIDSLSELGDVLLNELKKDPHLGQPKNALQLYGKYNEQINSYVRYFRDLSCNVVMTCLEATVTDGLEKTAAYHLPGTNIKNSLKGFIDVCLHYKIYENEAKEKFRKLVTSSEESILAKDRSGKLKPFEENNLLMIFNKILKGE